jgi:hypothetical protein
MRKREGRRKDQEIVALVPSVDGKPAKMAAAEWCSGVRLGWPGAEFRGENEGETERRSWGLRGVPMRVLWTCGR